MDPSGGYAVFLHWCVCRVCRVVPAAGPVACTSAAHCVSQGIQGMLMHSNEHHARPSVQLSLCGIHPLHPSCTLANFKVEKQPNLVLRIGIFPPGRQKVSPLSKSSLTP